MSNGKAISSIQTSVKEVQVYGEKEVVDAIEFIYAEIPVDNISEDKTLSVNLIKPSGVRYMSETTTKITIKVENQSQRTIDGIIVHADGNSDYSAGAASEEDQKISVIVSGVDSVIKNISPNQLRASVNLTGLKPGKHTVKVNVQVTDESLKDKVTVKPIKTEVTIIIK
jgi:YbbR domain-containing protein